MQLTPVALDVVVLGMKQYPGNMADFMDMFPTEDACLEYLSLVRWPDGYKCLRCGKGGVNRRAKLTPDRRPMLTPLSREVFGL